MEGDDRVEIELTPNAPQRTRREQRPPGSEPAEEHHAIADVAAWASSPSHRTPLIATVVGLAALVIGLAIGRSTGGNPDEASESPSTTATPTTEPASTDPTVPTFEAIDPTTTAGPPTTAPLVETTTVEVHPTITGAPFVMVGVDHEGRLIDVDLASGTMTARRDVVPRDTGPLMIWAGADWTLLPDWSTGNGVLVGADGEFVETDLTSTWQVIESEDSGHFWLVDDNVYAGHAGTARRVNRFGEPSRSSIELNQQPLYSDPRGGLVVISTGNTYSVDIGGVTKIADGEVLALDTERALSRVCDDQLQCKYVVVDRRTGEAQDTPLDASVRYVTGMWPPTDMSRIAPDGHTVAVAWATDTTGIQTVGLADLQTGTVTELTRAGYWGIRWSPDGRFAIYVDDSGVPTAHEIRTGDSFPVASDLPRMVGLAIRPPAP